LRVLGATIARWHRPNIRMARPRLRFSRVPSAEAVAANFEFRGRVQRCAELLEFRGKDVLNVGAGIGWLERYAIGSGARSVSAVDVSPESLEVARKFAPRATFVLGSALELPFEADTFDAVTMFDVLEHLPPGTEAHALQEIRRVLRPGGLLALSTPHRHWLSTYTDPAFYFGHRHYGKAELRALVGRAEFAIQRMTVVGSVFDQLDLLLYYACRHLFGRERHPFDWVRARADREWRANRGWNCLLMVAQLGPSALA
jgi:SAM-dependent methyltransferase